jgi:hypothetical protein
MSYKGIKYVRVTKGTLGYVRDYPLRLQRIVQGRRTKQFSMALGLSAGARESEVLKARALADEAYDQACLFLENSDPNTFERSQIDKMAMTIFRRHDPIPGSDVLPVFSSGWY